MYRSFCTQIGFVQRISARFWRFGVDVASGFGPPGGSTTAEIGCRLNDFIVPAKRYPPIVPMWSG